MSLLTIVQAACDRLGIARPTVVMASTDDTIRVMRALATQEGRELAARAIWQRLTLETSFTTLAQQVQTSAIPADFACFVNNTMWNYTQQEAMTGPLEPHQWQAMSANMVATSSNLYYRVRGNDIILLPDPTAGDTIKYEYVSSYWVDTDADGLGETDAWAADANTSLLPEELLTLGITWRWLKRNRLQFSDEFAEYTAQVNQAIGRDGGRAIVNMGGAAMDERVPGTVGTRSSSTWGALTGVWDEI
jgi:hypothetical protein